MNLERWLPVVGYEGFYEVSDQGNVRSVTRVDALGRTWKGQPMQVHPTRRGHLRTQLRREGTVKRKHVHRLVLEAFVGPCPNGMECCHGDGNPQNNRLPNLRWDTRQANVKDSVMHGAHPRGERVGNAKLTADQVLSVRTAHRGGEAIKGIARRLGVHQSTIQDIVHRRSWRHI